MLKKIVVALGTIIAMHVAPTYVPTLAPAQQEIPSYAKWGRLAMKEVHAKYPNANIIDYLHEGSAVQGNSTIEKFKLWLKEDTKEFGVFVSIEYTTATEQVTNIEFQETSK